QESYERQLSVERDELELMPEEEEEELTLIYQAKGVERSQAHTLAKAIVANRGTALDTLAREELGMAPQEIGSPWVAAITSFVLFTVGATVPALPWIFTGGAAALVASAVAAGLALFVAGAVTTLFSGRGVFYLGMRMLLLGAAGAALTFGIGRALGAGTG